MIIGLHGHIGAGKDTVADYLVAKYNFKKIGFSDQLYAGICGLFDITLEEALEWKQGNIVVAIQNQESAIPTRHITLGQYTWREFLQHYGTEMGRKTWGEDFWIDMFEKKYLEQHSSSDFFVVRDVRFNNEAALLGSYGGTIWEVLRPGYDGDGHESEAGIEERHIDGELTNDGTIEELHEMLDWWMEELNA